MKTGFLFLVLAVNLSLAGDSAIDALLLERGGPPKLSNPLEGRIDRGMISYVLISMPNNEVFPIEEFYRISGWEFGSELFRKLENSEMTYTPILGLFPPRYILFFSEEDELLASFQFWFEVDRFRILECTFEDGKLISFESEISDEIEGDGEWSQDYWEARVILDRTNYLYVENFSLVIRALEGLQGAEERSHESVELREGTEHE